MKRINCSSTKKTITLILALAFLIGLSPGTAIAKRVARVGDSDTDERTNDNTI